MREKRENERGREREREGGRVKGGQREGGREGEKRGERKRESRGWEGGREKVGGDMFGILMITCDGLGLVSMFHYDQIRRFLVLLRNCFCSQQRMRRLSTSPSSFCPSSPFTSPLCTMPHLTSLTKFSSSTQKSRFQKLSNFAEVPPLDEVNCDCS